MAQTIQQRDALGRFMKANAGRKPQADPYEREVPIPQPANDADGPSNAFIVLLALLGIGCLLAVAGAFLPIR